MIGLQRLLFSIAHPLVFREPNKSRILMKTPVLSGFSLLRWNNIRGSDFRSLSVSRGSGRIKGESQVIKVVKSTCAPPFRTAEMERVIDLGNDAVYTTRARPRRF